MKNVSSDYVKPTSFILRKGEVLGFSGLVGAGRTEVMRAIIGADRMKSGEVWLEGKKIVNHSPKEAMDNGIVLVPEDRKMQGNPGQPKREGQHQHIHAGCQLQPVRRGGYQEGGSDCETGH